jgi:MFS family permease
MVGWSAATLGTGFTHSYGQALACRLILGAFESGLLPCMIFIISTVWNRSQQAKRVAVIYCATTISGAFGGLIAYGIQTMGTRLGLEAWRWLFIIEGCISMTAGCIFFFTIPTSAEKGWFLSDEQAKCMRAKKERDALFKGQSKLEPKHVWAALKDPLVYLTGLSLFASSLPLLGFGTFLPAIILGFGYVDMSYLLLLISSPANELQQLSVHPGQLYDYTYLHSSYHFRSYCVLHVGQDEEASYLPVCSPDSCAYWLFHRHRNCK